MKRVRFYRRVLEALLFFDVLYREKKLCEIIDYNEALCMLSFFPVNDKEIKCIRINNFFLFN